MPSVTAGKSSKPGRCQQETGGSVGSSEWKVGRGGLETKTKGARVRVGRVQRQGQQQWLPATGLPVNHSTLSLCHCFFVVVVFLSL